MSALRRFFPYALVLFGLLILPACQTTPAEDDVHDPEQQGVAERVRHYRGAIAKSPDDPELRYRAGNALLDMGRYHEAYLAYQKAVQLRPDYADAYSNLGLALRKLGNLKAATGAYLQALELNPDDTVTLNNLATLSEVTEDWERMKWCYGKLHALDPDNLNYTAAYAALLYGLEDYAAAIPVYEQLIAARQEPSANSYRLGYCHFALEHHREAIVAWERAYSLSPENPSVNRGLVAAYAAIGDAAATRTAAARCAKLGISLDPDLRAKVGAVLGGAP